MAEQESMMRTGTDLLDCSRYGEVEDVEAILSSGVDANHQDKHGNTALHLSCANGHADVIRALIKAGACHLPNAAGNRPLQWAVQNKHVACVKTLLELYPESSQMNVLDKNGFGKSALTDAFMTGDADLVKMILNHNSAEEDMLLSQSSLGKNSNPEKKSTRDTAATTDNPPEPSTSSTANSTAPAHGTSTPGDDSSCSAEHPNGEEADAEASITHELGFGIARALSHPLQPEESESEAVRTRSSSSETGTLGDQKAAAFLVRELPIRNPDECFGDDAREDTTGLCLWGASVVLARWVASPEMQERLGGKSVLELGAGCGAGGISAAVHGKPASVMITDLNVETMANMAHNIELNRDQYLAGTKVRAATLDWEDESTWAASSPPCDIVLGCDLVYQASVAPKLLHTIFSLLKPGGTFFHVCPVEGERDGLEEFLADLGVVEAGKGGGGVGDVSSKGAAMCGGGGSSGFELVSVVDAPADYARNPLVSGSEEQYLLHFNELPTTTYRLMECRKKSVAT